MNHWILKTEPSCYSWEDMLREKATFWSGIRNPQARNNMQAMKPGDRAFFYHTGGERRIMGVVEIMSSAARDTTTQDPQWVGMDIRVLKTLHRPMALTTLKLVPELSSMVLLKQGRLSVSPVTLEAFDLILALSGTKLV